MKAEDFNKKDNNEVKPKNRVSLRTKRILKEYGDMIEKDKNRLKGFGSLGILKASPSVFEELDDIKDRLDGVVSGEISLEEFESYIEAYNSGESNGYKLASERLKNNVINEIFGVFGKEDKMKDAYEVYKKWKAGFKPKSNEPMSMSKIALAFGISPKDFQRYIDSMGGINEEAPPGMEDWIKKRKKQFKKQYGDDWERILYSTAWKMKNKNESIDDDDIIVEKAPPGMEDWVKSHKKEFKNRYGDKWQKVLYATAWKIKNNRSTHESYLKEVELMPEPAGDRIKGDALLLNYTSEIVKNFVDFEKTGEFPVAHAKMSIGGKFTIQHLPLDDHTKSILLMIIDNDMFSSFITEMNRLIEEMYKTKAIDGKKYSADQIIDILPFKSLIQKYNFVAGLLKYNISPKFKHGAWISTIYVNQSHRGTGIAKSMYDLLMNKYGIVISDYVQTLGGQTMWSRFIHDSANYDVFAFPEKNPDDLAEVYIDKDGEIEFDSLDTVEDSIFDDPEVEVYTDMDKHNILLMAKKR